VFVCVLENLLPVDQDDAGHGLSQVCVRMCVRGSGQVGG